MDSTTTSTTMMHVDQNNDNSAEASSSSSSSSSSSLLMAAKPEDFVLMEDLAPSYTGGPKVCIRSMRAEDVPKTNFFIPRDALKDIAYFEVHLMDAACSEIEIPYTERGAIRDCVLKMILEFALFRFNNPEKKANMDKLALDKSNSDVMDDHDKAFVQSLDVEKLTCLVIAVNFLNYPSLHLLAQKEYARRIKMHKPEELKDYFRIPDDKQGKDRKP
jgi:hypothetical protein